MNITKTQWPPEDLPADARTTFAADVLGESDMDPSTDGYHQPGFEIALGWNRPHVRWWQPYLVIHIWTWNVQIGWCYE